MTNKQVNKTTEALKLAEEALEGWKEYDTWTDQQMWNDDDEEALAAIREALTEPVKQEPVAWAHPSGGYLSARYMKEFATGLEKETYTIPLYVAPQPVSQEYQDHLVNQSFDWAAMAAKHQFMEGYQIGLAEMREKNNANNNS